MKRNADSLPTRSVSEFRWTVSQRSSIESPLCTTTKLEWGKGKQKRKEKEATWAAEEEERLTTENNVAYKRRTHLSTNWLAAEKLPERNLPNGKNFTTKNSTKERERNKREKKKKERPKLQEWETQKERNKDWCWLELLNSLVTTGEDWSLRTDRQTWKTMTAFD